MLNMAISPYAGGAGQHVDVDRDAEPKSQIVTASTVATLRDEVNCFRYIALDVFETTTQDGKPCKDIRCRQEQEGSLSEVGTGVVRLLGPW